MNSPTWPANVISRQLTDYALRASPDGAATEMVITTRYDNGHVSVARHLTRPGTTTGVPKA